MCGIVGYAGKRPAVDLMLKGLKRLEYRGYDSAGVAFFEGSALHIEKSEGKLSNVLQLLKNSSHAQAVEKSRCGVGHTRWATHGSPTTQNAHPHRTGPVVIVHNGIIENYQEIRADLVKRGHEPTSETDSELFGFLVWEEIKKGQDLVTAVRHAFQRLRGLCSVVVLCENNPGVFVAVRNGSPLVVARDPKGGSMVASDAQPLVEYTQDVVFLENGDLVVGREDGFQIFSVSTGQAIERPVSHLNWSAEEMDKGGYPHYMLKEIFEQPRAMIDTINGLVDRASGRPFDLSDQPGLQILREAEEFNLIACGTSWHAAMVGKYWIERVARLPVQVDLASEFRYRKPVIGRHAVVVGITQSGETADTLAVIQEMKSRGIPSLALTNVRGSTMSREAQAAFFTSAGPEIGVASTKAFISQLASLFLWAGYLGLQRGSSDVNLAEMYRQLIELPHMLEAQLQNQGETLKGIRAIAQALYQKKGFFFMGRGLSFPLALEAALKLKEIAYIHAEGYAAGELKHGPIAMIDPEMVVVVLAPEDQWREKTLSNLQEMKARGGIIVGVGNPEDLDMKKQCQHWIPLPLSGQRKQDDLIYPFLITPIIQLLAYEIAVKKGTDIDQPRNLAKSVTVE